MSTATEIVNFHGLPTAAKICHKFPDNQLVDPLLSLGKLTEHGCRIVFKKDMVEVTNSDGLLILVGQKPIGRNIYTVPLPLGQLPQNIPRTLQVVTPTKNINPMEVLTNSRDSPAQLLAHHSPPLKLGSKPRPEVSFYMTGHSKPQLTRPGLNISRT